jgi:CSLREA domain-containing protein
MPSAQGARMALAFVACAPIRVWRLAALFRQSAGRLAMRRHPSSWTTTLAKLGLRRKPRKRYPSANRFGRLARIEHLESRQLLAVVNTLADTTDADPNVTSLREAIASGGFVTFASELSGGTIRLTQGQLVVGAGTTIDATSSGPITVDAHGDSRVFYVSSGATATIRGLTITGGATVAPNTDGGGVYSLGNLTLDAVKVIGNQATYAGGGIFSNGGTLSLTHSTVDGNRSLTHAGGINMGPGTLTIQNSTISHNQSGATQGYAAGLNLWGTATATIENSTFSGNAGLASGAVRVDSSTVALTMRHATIVDNAATSGSGGLHNAQNSSQVTVLNSVVAGNTGGDVAGNLAPGSGGNLFGFGGPAGFGTVLAQGESPKLTPLGDHGGPTFTHALLPGSMAIDRGLPGNVGSLTHDQRGRTRVMNRPDGGSSTVDIGAVELAIPFGPKADFNGDGRTDDQLLIRPQALSSWSQARRWQAASTSSHGGRSRAVRPSIRLSSATSTAMAGTMCSFART